MAQSFLWNYSILIDFCNWNKTLSLEIDKHCNSENKRFENQSTIASLK